MIEIEEKLKMLPTDLQNEVIDFIDFLLNKHSQKIHRKNQIKFDWIGGLKEYRDKYTSVELQKKASEWRD